MQMHIVLGKGMPSALLLMLFLNRNRCALSDIRGKHFEDRTLVDYNSGATPQAMSFQISFFLQ